MSDGIVELRIDAIAAGGDGVGRDAGGRVVFVPLTAPEDLVRAEIVTAKPRWARARLRELLEPAADRRPAPCPVFGECGGCRLQHLPEDSQAAAKRQVVAAALLRIGGLEVEVPPLIRAGEPLGYRNRVTLTVREGRSGFHALHAPDEVVDCPNCLLAEAPVRTAWDALTPFALLPQPGELRVTIRASAAGQVALLVEGGRTEGDPRAVVERLHDLESYWWVDDAGDRHLLAGRETFAERWQGIRFELDPGVFLQVNREVAAAMDAWLDRRIEQSIGPLEDRRVSDLYAGVGARPIRWAQAGAAVSTCESDAAACAATREAARRAGVGLEVIEGRVEDHPGLLTADLVVVNPPRAGLGTPVRDALAAGQARFVAYVSCDPATLARDLAHVAGAYDVVAVQPFDAFPQTAHVETIAWLERCQASEMADPAAEEGPDADADVEARGSAAAGEEAA